MSTQTLANLVLFAVSVLLGAHAWRRRRVDEPGFGIRPTRRSPVHYLVGVALGGGAVAIGCLLLVAFGRAQLSSGEPAGGEIAALVLYFVVLAAVEEIAFRGLLLTGLRTLLHRTWPAVLASSALVAVPYLLGDHITVLTVLSALLAGVMYGTAFVVTRSVWTSAGMRMAWNVVQGPILGFTVSGDVLTEHPLLTADLDGSAWVTGGRYGPEGGVVVIAMRVLVIAALIVVARRAPTVNESQDHDRRARPTAQT